MDWIDAVVKAGHDPRDVPPDMWPLLKLVFAYGQIDGEVGMSGAAAEAAKDCRQAGLHDAADLIERKTIPETLATEKSNAAAYLTKACQ